MEKARVVIACSGVCARYNGAVRTERSLYGSDNVCPTHLSHCALSHRKLYASATIHNLQNGATTLVIRMQTNDCWQVTRREMQKIYFSSQIILLPAEATAVLF